MSESPPPPTSQRAPVARGLTNWPAAPPRFDDVFGSTQFAQSVLEPATIDREDLNAWILRLADADVTAVRQNSPDLVAQLNLAIRRPIDRIFCTVLDVDPSACVQSAAAAAMADDLIAGLQLLRAATRATDVTVVVDARVPRSWWTSLRNAVKGAGSGVRIVELVFAYPQADPTLLLYTLANRRLPPRSLPGEVGAIVIDGIAAISIGALVVRNERLDQLPLVVRDRDRHESYFVRAPVSMTVAQILRTLNLGKDARAMNVRGGDLLRDLQIDAAQTLVRNSELVLHIASPLPPINPEACIRCGWCLEACPTRVQPANVLEAAQTGDRLMAERAGLSACIECGICSYVCPSRLPLLPAIRSLLSTK